MIHTEFYRTREDGVNLYKSYSDINHYIIQDYTGNKYIEAIDIEDAPYTYTESDKEIVDEEPLEMPDEPMASEE